MAVLDLRDNSLTSLDRPPPMRQLHTLLLDDNRLQEIPADFLDAAPRLTHISARNNRLGRVPTAAMFARHRRVESLDMRANRIGTLDSTDLIVLSQVRRVELGRNRIGTWPAPDGYLMYEHNGLNSSSWPEGGGAAPFDEAAFYEFGTRSSGGWSVRLPETDATAGFDDAAKEPEARIEFLSVENNELSMLPPNAFVQLRSLKELKLNKNRIQHLHKETFAQLHNLTVLELTRNRVRQLDALAFGQLAELRRLRLAKNGLKRLHDGAFWGLNSLAVLDLTLNRLAAVKRAWLFGLSSLVDVDLSNNAISYIEPNCWTNTPLVSKLDLSGNRLAFVGAKAFSPLPRLRWLSLARNHISAVHPSAMSDLDSLQFMNVSRNALRPVLEDASAASVLFGDLHALESLDISANGLKSLVVGPLAHCRIKHLYAARNQFTVIDRVGMEQLAHLRSIALNTSSLLCDCDARWLRTFVGSLPRGGSDSTKSSATASDAKYAAPAATTESASAPRGAADDAAQQHGGVSLVCGHPSGLRGSDLMRLEDERLVCDEGGTPLPRLISQPATRVLTVRGAALVSLACVVAAPWHSAGDEEDSALAVNWFRDGQPLSSVPDEGLSLSLELVLAPAGDKGGGREAHYAGTLRLADIRDSDAGTYQCVARNAFGADYGKPVQLIVNVAPTLRKRPSNSTLPVGGTARLECAADGRPAPVLLWRKERPLHYADGGSYVADEAAGYDLQLPHVGADGRRFPAADERRFHVLPSDDVFYIVNVKLADAGTYTCEASNTAGTASASARIDVVQPAAAAKPMGDKAVAVGSTAVLECLVVGHPPPTVRWFKNGEPLNAGADASPPRHERVSLTADGQLLVIVRAQTADQAPYACSADNGLGQTVNMSASLDTFYALLGC